MISHPAFVCPKFTGEDHEAHIKVHLAAANDPKLKEKSDFQIEWEYLKNGHIDELNIYIKKFIGWLDQEK